MYNYAANHQNHYNKLISSPAKYFDHPLQVVQSRLPVEVKENVLEQWEDEFVQLQNAQTENMFGDDHGVELKAIKDAQIAMQRKKLNQPKVDD